DPARLPGAPDRPSTGRPTASPTQVNPLLRVRDAEAPCRSGQTGSAGDQFIAMLLGLTAFDYRQVGRRPFRSGFREEHAASPIRSLNADLDAPCAPRRTRGEPWRPLCRGRGRGPGLVMWIRHTAAPTGSAPIIAARSTPPLTRTGFCDPHSPTS